METNQQKDKKDLNRANNAQGDIGRNNSANNPDAEMQNDTGYAGTTNAVSESRNTDDGYQIAPEDTLIGYDGDESQLDMDLGNENDNTKNRGIDDND
ncbi:hypothetical protein [Pedobacter sp.]|uniref:hypothetical protein n=1 Tax=Pedobacter sp. TaxID=1411316 RepID=UPI003D7FD115